MAAGGAGLLGNWGGLTRRFGALGRQLKEAQKLAPVSQAAYLASEIRKGITSQAPGGVAFAKLAQATIDRKGSSKALIDTADMRNSVTHQEVENGVQFIGLLRTQQHKKKGAKGEEISEANLGYIHEVVGVPIGAQFKGDINLANLTVKRTVKRPFIMPVWNMLKDQIEKNIVRYVEKVLKG